MKIIFGDLSELPVQSAFLKDGALHIKTISATAAELKTKFEDLVATRKMQIEEMGKVTYTYYDFTKLYRLEDYGAGILGVVMYKPVETPEAQAEVQAAAIEVARIQAQSLTDADALTVKSIYPEWEKVIGKEVDPGFKFLYGEDLYKVITPDKLVIQGQYVPGEGTESLYVHIDEAHAGTLEDPIPYTGNMELEKDKYYLQHETIYKCMRGTEIAVHQDLINLIGIYVETV